MRTIQELTKIFKKVAKDFLPQDDTLFFYLKEINIQADTMDITVCGDYGAMDDNVVTEYHYFTLIYPNKASDDFVAGMFYQFCSTDQNKVKPAPEK